MMYFPEALKNYERISQEIRDLKDAIGTVETNPVEKENTMIAVDVLNNALKAKEKELQEYEYYSVYKTGMDRCE